MPSSLDKRAHCVCLWPKVCHDPIPLIAWLDSEDDEAYVVQRIAVENSDFKMKYERLPKSDWTLDRNEVKVIQTVSYSDIAEEDYP